MERLQIAIEKARAQRLAEGRPAAPAAPTGAGAPSGTASATAVAPVATPASAPGAASAPADDSAAKSAAKSEARRLGPNARPVHEDEQHDPAGTWAAMRPLFESGREPRYPGVIPAGSSPAAAAYNLLRTRMLQQARRNGWRRIAIVSPEMGDGKTTICANIAMGLSRQFDTRSIVLDFDLRRVGLSRLMRPRELSTGMEGVLSGEVAFPDHALRLGDNVALGLNDHHVDAPAELLQSGSTTAALAEMERLLRPDILIFDMPPLLVGDDNFGFLENADAALIVAAAESTPMSRIDTAERQVAELTEVMGIVLNKCRYPDRSQAYDY